MSIEDVADGTAFTACDCPEAVLLRELLTGEAPAGIDTPSWAALMWAAESIAVQKVRGAIHGMSAGSDWAAVSGWPGRDELAEWRAEPGRAALAWRERHGGEYTGRTAAGGDR